MKNKFLIFSIIILSLTILNNICLAQGEYTFISEDETFEERINNLTQDYAYLSNKVTELEAENERLGSENKMMQEKLDNALETVSHLTVENQLLESELKTQEKTGLPKEVREKDEKIKNLTEAIAILRDKLKSMQSLIERE